MKMKRIICLLTMLILTASFVFAADQYAHYMVGYVDTATDFTVSMLDEVLPFDLDSSEVKYNELFKRDGDGNISVDSEGKSIFVDNVAVVGLRVGVYTLFSNGNYSFTLTHTPFNLDESNCSDTDENHDKKSIDYRLYLIYDGKFLSCRSEGSIVLSGESGCSYVNQSLYVSLDEGNQATTEDVLSRLKYGNYVSDVTITLVSGT